MEEALMERELRLKTVDRNMPGAICQFELTADKKFRFPYVSESWLELSGVAPEEAMASSDSMFAALLPEDRDKVHRTIAQSATTLQPWHCEFRAMVKGKVKWILGSSIPEQPRPDGSILWNAVLMDITARKQAEEALRESEEKFRALADSAPVAILVIQDSKLVYVNDYTVRATGYSKDDLYSMKYWDIVHPDQRERVIEGGRAWLRGERAPTKNEIKYIPKSGETKWALSSIAEITYGGKPAAIAMMVGITDRKKVEELYQTVFENMGTAMAIIEEDTIISHVNDEAEKIWGYSREDIEGRMKWPDLIAQEDRAKMLEYHRMRRADPGSAPRSYEFRFVHKNGELRQASLAAAMIPGTRKSVVSIYDITERKRGEDALRQANKKLSLLSSITRHDINNQLQSLDGFLELLQRKTPDPSLEDYLSRITNASSQIAAMIRFTKEYEEIGVNSPVWQDIRTLVHTAAKEAIPGQVTLKNDLPLGMEVFADPLIIKVFFNLMDNTVRYGGKTPTLRFFAEDRDGNRCIVCEDDGPGVATEEKERIFERGFGKNTGLGLFLAREILDITGITIRENGKPGKGARFEMIVPKGIWHLADADRKVN
jgi:PAS domain S-box-containing protein